MNDFITSQIRTYVPAVVGAFAAWLLSKGVSLDADALTGLMAFLTGLLTALYYLTVRLAEKYLSPRFGWFLGYAKSPSYSKLNK